MQPEEGAGFGDRGLGQSHLEHKAGADLCCLSPAVIGQEEPGGLGAVPARGCRQRRQAERDSAIQAALPFLDSRPRVSVASHL